MPRRQPKLVRESNTVLGTVAKMAQYLGVSRMTIYRWRKAGIFPYRIATRPQLDAWRRNYIIGAYDEVRRQKTHHFIERFSMADNPDGITISMSDDEADALCALLSASSKDDGTAWRLKLRIQHARDTQQAKQATPSNPGPQPKGDSRSRKRD